MLASPRQRASRCSAPSRWCISSTSARVGTRCERAGHPKEIRQPASPCLQLQRRPASQARTSTHRLQSIGQPARLQGRGEFEVRHRSPSSDCRTAVDRRVVGRGCVSGLVGAARNRSRSGELGLELSSRRSLCTLTAHLAGSSPTCRAARCTRPATRDRYGCQRSVHDGTALCPLRLALQRERRCLYRDLISWLNSYAPSVVGASPCPQRLRPRKDRRLPPPTPSLRLRQTFSALARTH